RLAVEPANDHCATELALQLTAAARSDDPARSDERASYPAALVPATTFPVRGELAGLAVNVKEHDDFPVTDSFDFCLAFRKPQPILTAPGQAKQNNTIMTTIRAREETDDPFDPETELVVDVNVTIAVSHVP